MALREDLLPIFGSARQLIQDLGLRQFRVYVRRGDWSTGEVHLGTLTNSDTEITPRPKVVDMGGHRKRLSGITPSYSGGGWSPSDLLPAVAAGRDYYLILQGPDGTLDPYRTVEIDATGSFGWTMVVERLGRVMPDFG